MNEQERGELKQKIIEEIRTQKHLIESFTETSKPVAPDNAIGRLTRMEAISSQGISEASLNSSKAKLVKLEKALEKINLALNLSIDNQLTYANILDTKAELLWKKGNIE